MVQKTTCASFSSVWDKSLQMSESNPTWYCNEASDSIYYLNVIQKDFFA